MDIDCTYIRYLLCIFTKKNTIQNLKLTAHPAALATAITPTAHSTPRSHSRNAQQPLFLFPFLFCTHLNNLIDDDDHYGYGFAIVTRSYGYMVMVGGALEAI
jgi:hypothetical protein